MNFLHVKKLANGLFRVLLPVCSADVLTFVLEKDIPYVWLLKCRSHSLGDRLQSELKNLFPHATHEVVVRCWAAFDFGLSTDDFLAELGNADVRSEFWDGVKLIQSCRPLPRRFDMDAVSDRSQVGLFRDMGIHLEFDLPHAREYAMVQASNPEVLEAMIERVKPYFVARNLSRPTAELGAAPNGGPAAPVGSSGVTEGPPSVS